MTNNFERSKMFRNGRLKGAIRSGAFDKNGEIIPFLSFQLESNIYIGFGENVSEIADVLVVGTPSVEFVNTVQPVDGDAVAISFATAYFNPKSNRMAIRVMSPEQISIIPQAVAETAKCSSSEVDFIEAADYFKEFMKQRAKSNP